MRFGLRMSASDEWLALQHGIATTPPVCSDDSEMWTSDDALERQQAAQLCISCPLLDPCRAFAITNREEFGTWGGRDRTVQRRMTA